MTWEEVCYELNFVDTSAKAYRKSWNKNLRLVKDKNKGFLTITLKDYSVPYTLLKEDKEATDWCIEYKD